MEYWDWWDPTGQPSTTEYFKQIKSNFEAANSGTTLNITYPAFGDYETKLLTAAAANTVPDVIHTSVAWTRGFWQKGAIEDLTARVKLTPSVGLDQFVKSALFYNQYQGKVYGVPVEGPDSNVLMYNADMFKSASIDPDVGLVNKWTWDDFFNNAVKLTKKAGDKTTVAGFDGSGADIYNLSMYGYSDGCGMYNDDQSAVGWNNPQGIETLQFIADINTSKWQGKATWGANDKPPDTKNGRIYDSTAAMSIAGTWNATAIKDFAPNSDLRMALMPRGPSGQQNGTMSWENMIALPKGSKNTDGGWAFATYYASKDALLIRLAVLNRVGPRKDLFASQQYQDITKKVPDLINLPPYGDIGGPYPFVQGTNINKVASPVLQKAAKGQLSATDGIKQAADLANNVLKNPT